MTPSLFLRRAGLGLALSWLVSAPAFAGVLTTVSAKWGSFAARPEASETTPNYYGLGLGVGFGYSFSQVFDLALFTHYVPARLSAAKIGVEDAQFFAYGAETALRFSQSVYVALRGGFGRYKLLHERRLTQGDEIPGSWEGPAGGFSIGAIHPLGKQNFFQTSLDVMHAITEDNDGEVKGKRRFDLFTISIAYVFNHRESSLADNSIFKSFLDSIIFF